jgi:hypothetical protein
MANEEKPNVVSLSATCVGSSTSTAALSVRANFSLHHLLGAFAFSRRIGELEAANAGQPLGAFFEEMKWLSSSCVLNCVAGLESYINEVFADRSQHFADVKPEIIEKLWELSETKAKVLEKFDLALMLRSKPKLNTGARPTQDIQALVSLRNALVHFKPEWDDKQTDHEKLSRLLANKFKPNQHFGPHEPFFPKRWISHGCSQWATSSSVAFLEAFERDSGIKKLFPEAREQLKE